MSRLPQAWRTFRFNYQPRTGLVNAPLLGIMFGLGWTPCIGPTLAAVLTLAGLFQVTGFWLYVMSWLQYFIAGWTVPL